MRIESSSVAMNSARSYKAETKAVRTDIDRYHGDGVERVRVNAVETTSRAVEMDSSAAVFINKEVPDGSPAAAEQNTTQQSSSRPENSENTASQKDALRQMAEVPQKTDWLADITEQINNDPTIQMLRKALDMLERFTGKKYNHDVFDTGKSMGSGLQLSASAVSMKYQAVMANFGGAAELAPRAEGGSVNGFWTRQTVESGFVKGEEHTAFSSAGTVVTSDGRTLNFGISVEMSRSFEEAYDIVGHEAVYTDPLVINLDTDAAALSDVTFYFDLNGDGVKEEISELGSGSGFLALDKNGDGKINDGTELFGARSGDGFAELAQYDSDGNGWIDEGDEVYSKLSVWVKCGSTSKLLSLSEANVGAIFLGSQSTQHSIADSNGNVGAQIRRSGVYLKETGEAGTIQHVDFKS